ncbi:hypothetical protein HK102_014067 [Quaeritorhiza haematococci]|nr:hypothetical protein HK102_014067 [Quaeritorhiza haematococci]
MSADALEENWVADEVPESTETRESSEPQNESASADGTGGLKRKRKRGKKKSKNDSGAEETGAKAAGKTGGKRKAAEEEEENEGEKKGDSEENGKKEGEAAAAEGKSKKPKKKKRKYDDEEAVGPTSHEQSDFVWNQYVKTKCKDMSDLEMDEVNSKKPEETSYFDTSSFAQPHDADHLEEFIKHVIPTWKTTLGRSSNDGGKKKKDKNQKEENGKPKVLIVCASAIRCADLFKHLRSLNAMCHVAKLFAKHFKVSEQVDYLSKNVVRVGLGTPNRLIKLIEECELLSSCELLIIDMHKDLKQRTIFTVPECRQDLLNLLGDHVFERVKTGGMKVVLF